MGVWRTYSVTNRISNLRMACSRMGHSCSIIQYEYCIMGH